MGIKNLKQILKTELLIEKVPVSNLSGKRVGIDASLNIYQVHLKGVEGSHMRGIFNRIIKMLKSNITPVFFFDGAPPELKRHTIDDRKAKIDAGKGINIPDGVFDSIKELLRIMKIEYIESPGEAEAQAAHASQVGFVDVVSTEDTDALPFGTTMQCLGLNATAKTINMINYEKVLLVLDLTHESLIDLCLLLGSDYTKSTIKGIGVKSALKLIKKHKSIEKIIENENIPAEKYTGFNYKEARVEFLRPNILNIYPNQRLLPKYTEDEIANIIEFLAKHKVHIDSTKFSYQHDGFKN